MTRIIPFLSFFFFFFPGSTHWFSILLYSASIALVVLPGLKNRRKNKFLLFPFFSLSSNFFHYVLTATAHARLEKIFSSVSLSLSLSPSLFHRHSHHYHYRHYFQPRQYVTVTYFWTRKYECKNICMYLSVLNLPSYKNKENFINIRKKEKWY